MNLTETQDMMAAIRGLKEQRLKLLDLARRAVKDDGTLDTAWLAMHHKEVEEASDEAESYAREVDEAIASLKTLLKES